VAGQPLDVFIAGDDQAAKDAVAALVRDWHLTPIDVGPLVRARQLEALGHAHEVRPPAPGTNADGMRPPLLTHHQIRHMKIVLFGATGNIGQRIAAEALRRGHQVVGVVRDPAQIEPPDPRVQLVP
jgi:predicted dinucleotide-binding enzyme